ncbi:brefeldin A-inhibited guanine nucleotide-exchange protein 3-like [Ruditapes philippinarum]|uniref:brefeldin A-inhibited guanine nucleotide-exchange protein 3-like n=1 Tax=Ruditapes philippinarum TaxID=129788 RepID=UPI00295BC8CF|nr:brefeldin A-inhibited guanine nucleotide-exchange protein 3-like [Ruditapes philippinarum]
MVTVLNADSIYSTSYSALSLTLNLKMKGYYDNKEATLIPVSEREFIDSVLDTDMFLYLSPDWLSTVYKNVLDTDILEEAGWNHDDDDSPLITTLKDIDGEGSHAIGGQMMRGNSYDDEDDNTSPATDSQLVNAGMYISDQW